MIKFKDLKVKSDIDIEKNVKVIWGEKLPSARSVDRCSIGSLCVSLANKDSKELSERLQSCKWKHSKRHCTVKIHTQYHSTLNNEFKDFMK